MPALFSYYGPLVKRSRRRPLTPQTGVRFSPRVTSAADRCPRHFLYLYRNFGAFQKSRAVCLFWSISNRRGAAFSFAVEGVQWTRAERVWDAAGASAACEHGGADDAVDAGAVFIQHRGQHLCGAPRDGCAHGGFAGVSAANIVLSAAVGMGVGVSSVLSISLGEGDRERANETATLGMALTAVHLRAVRDFGACGDAALPAPVHAGRGRPGAGVRLHVCGAVLVVRVPDADRHGKDLSGPRGDEGDDGAAGQRPASSTSCWIPF